MCPGLGYELAQDTRFCTSVSSGVNGGKISGGFLHKALSNVLDTWTSLLSTLCLHAFPGILRMLSESALRYWGVSFSLCDLKFQIFLLPVFSHLKTKFV